MIARARLPYAALAIGVLAASWSAILVREAAAPALVIGTYRMIFAGLPVGAWAVLQRHREPEPLTRATFAPLLLSAAFLTGHFAFWIASVQQTSVITSVVLVAAQPLYVALLSPVMLGERVERHVWLAIAVASAGALTMAAEDVTQGLGTLAGDGYAVVGGLFAALYLMVGRRVRPTVSWPRYVGTVYPLTALLLLSLTLIAREPLAAHSNYSWAMIALLAVGPQLVGHNAINWSLAYLPAVLVSVAILGEPVGATAWAAIVLGEHPSIAELAGAPLVLLGVALALRPGRPERAEAAHDVAT